MHGSSSGSSVHGIVLEEYWSGLLCPLPDLPDPEIKPASLTSPTLASRLFTTSATWQVQYLLMWNLKKKKKERETTNEFTYKTKIRVTDVENKL